MKEPVVRQEIYDAYWKFAAERHKIFELRVQGQAPPWTEDPILNKYKFCNTFRALDRVSQYMIRDVCYGDYETEEDRLFSIVAFRLFSNEHTWNMQRWMADDGAPGIGSLKAPGGGEWHPAKTMMGETLEETKADQGRLYTNAFILCANDAYGYGSKHLNHVALLHDMFVNNDFADDVAGCQTLQDLYDELHKWPLLGDFMSYQIAVDINYSTLTDFSENDFTVPGPGAVRGQAKVFKDRGGLTAQEAIMWMVEHQEEEFDRLGLEFNGLFGRPLHAIDCQGLFCETDKYCREFAPGLESNRTKIKQKYRMDPRPFEVFLPPKWGLEHDGTSVGVGTESLEEWF